jgi:hypothetical protein
MAVTFRLSPLSIQSDTLPFPVFFQLLFCGFPTMVRPVVDESSPGPRRDPQKKSN